MKYFFGLSIKLFKTPYIVQLTLSLILLNLTYVLAKKITQNDHLAFIATALLAIDPVVYEVSSQTLLDLGQAVFFLAYIFVFWFRPKKTLIQGLLLGLIIASKFYSTVLMIILFIHVIRFLFDKFNLNKEYVHIWSIAILFYIFTYTITIINKGFLEFVFIQTRIIKFMIEHNSATGLFLPLKLFITGSYPAWWSGEIIKSSEHLLLWPVAILAGFVTFISTRKKKIKIVSSIPMIFFLITFNQVPFTRYFILILPFLYITFAYFSLHTYEKARRFYSHR